MLELFFFCLIGSIGGLFVGLLSAGLGPIVIPALLLMLPGLGVPSDILMPIAITTSLSIILVTSGISACLHHRNNSINKRLFLQLLPGSLIGALIGAMIVISMPNAVLKIAFSILLMMIGIHMTFPRKNKQRIYRTESNFRQFFTASTLIATLSNLLGVSDGLLLIPYLKRHNISMIQAVGTATALVLPVSSVGLMPLIIAGVKQPSLPHHCLSYVYLPAFFCIGVMSIIFSIIGVKLGKKISEGRLKSIFGYGLILLGCRMLLV